jgi:AGCS family alanine or glycine:cation symporter
VGSAAIAHSAAKTDEPIREGIVALLEPFIDTIIVCFTTGIVIVVTGVYADPATAGLDGVQLTSAAFGSVFSWFPFILSITVFLFAYSTMISWSYYGERCWTFLFGTGQSMTYRAIFLCFVWLGCVSNLSNVTDFSDLMILAMAFPNILGVVLLSGKLREALESYWTRFQNGEFERR